MSCTTCAIISLHKRGISFWSGCWILYIDGEAGLSTTVIYAEQIEEVLVTNGEAHTGRPAKNTRADGKAREVGVLASQSFVHEDVSCLT